MAYFSKTTVLSAFRCLSSIVDDPNVQGATQKVSALRYFLAVDSFYRQFNRPCDTTDRNDGKVLFEKIGNVVSVYDGFYTKNFTHIVSHSGDYNTRSNFFSAGKVVISKTNNHEEIVYPSRGDDAFIIKDATLIRSEDLVHNIQKYVPHTNQQAALAVWLLRDCKDIDESDVYESVKKALLSEYTDLMVTYILPEEQSFIGFFSGELQGGFSSEKAILEFSDFDTLIVAGDGSKGKGGDEQFMVYFGAPGTGKSYTLNGTVGSNNPHVFRTTFHPDSDYASFVGSYKPVVRKVKSIPKNLSEEQLVDILREQKSTMGTYGSYLFFYLYCDYFNGTLNNFNVPEFLEMAGESNSDEIEYYKMNFIADWVRKNQLANFDGRITYEYVPQVFTKAYVDAWKNPDDTVYLVIEEINRGNCAQIFGDIFQLLDKNDNNESEYPISVDVDLAQYIEGQLGEGHEGIKDGNLTLPKNLRIYATMNTTDQSLFPMDSAFKRRWGWKYFSIKDEGRGFYIDVVGITYDWWAFISKINEKIIGLTHSEDKQIGYWFVKLPKDQKRISLDTFVSKVVFFLWSDVFKDYALGESSAFSSDTTFAKMFDNNGNIIPAVVKDFMAHNNIPSFDMNADEVTDSELPASESTASED